MWNCVHVDAHERVWVGGEGLWTFEDAELRRVPDRGGFHASYVVDLASDGGRLYALAITGSLRISSDGKRWSSRRTGLTRGARLVAHDGVLVVRDEGGALAISRDHGKTFELMGSLPCHRGPLAFDTASSALYAAVSTSYNEVRCSRDGGRTWVSHANGPPGLHPLRSLHAHDGVLVAITHTGIWRCEAGAPTFELVHPIESLRALGGHGLAPILAVGTAGTVLGSVDGGATWTRASLGLQAELVAVACTASSLCIAGHDGVVMTHGAASRAHARVAEARHEAPSVWTALPPTLSIDSPPRRALSRLHLGAPETARHASAVLAVAVVGNDLVSADETGRLLMSSRRVDDHAPLASGWDTQVLVDSNPRRIEQLVVCRDRLFLADDRELRTLDGDASGVSGGAPPRWLCRGDTLFEELIWRPLAFAWNEAEHALVPVALGARPVLDIDATGTLVLVQAHDAGSQASVEICERDSLEPVARVKTRGLWDLGFGATGELVARDLEKGDIVAFSYTGSRRPRRRPFLGVRVARNERFLATISSSRCRVYDLRDDTLVWEAEGAPSDVRGKWSLSADGAQVVLATHDSIEVLTRAGRKVVMRLGLERHRPDSELLIEGPFELIAADWERVVVCKDRQLTTVDVETSAVHDFGGLSVTLGKYAHASLAGDVLLVADGNGRWHAVELATGRVRWSRALPLHQLTPLGAHAYGFEAHSTYSAGRTGHVLQRVDLRDGSFERVSLSAPPGSDDADGYGTAITRVGNELLLASRTREEGVFSVLLEPETGARRRLDPGPGEVPVVVSWTNPTTLMASRSARHVVSTTERQIFLRELGEHTMPLVAVMSTATANQRPFAVSAAPEHDRIVAMVSGRLHVWTATGALVADLEAPAPDGFLSVPTRDAQTLVLAGISGLHRVALP